MGFYIRKSVKAGPFRFNFSKSGVGVSVGVRGLRIGTGPRGHYIHAGVGGFYYRASLGKAGNRNSPRQQFVMPSPSPGPGNDDVAMIEIDSSDVMGMRDETFGELLDELNAKSRQVRLSVALCWAGIAIGALAAFVTGGPGVVLGAIALPAWALGSWFDSYRRSSVLFYDLEGDAETAYAKLGQSFDGLRNCAGKWHVEAGGAITNLTAWKRNAGASHLVNKKPTALAYSLPSVIKSNVTPPSLNVGRQVMYFFPDVVLMQDGASIGAIAYSELELRWQDSRFIEDGPVPSDATVVDYTWKHPNKSGGPDRRFRDNRQIPICLYEVIHFQSASGVNELVEFSRTGNAAPFGAACSLLAALPRAKAPAITGPAIQNADADTAPDGSTAPRRRMSPVVATIAAFTVFLALPLVLAVASGTRKDARSIRDMEAPLVAPTTENNIVSRPPSEDVRSEPDQVDAPQAATRDTTVNDGPGATMPSEQAKAAPQAAAQPAHAVKTLNSATTRYGVNLRDGPSKTYRILSTLRKDVAVTVLEPGADWTRVRTDQGAEGWLITDSIQ